MKLDKEQKDDLKVGIASLLCAVGVFCFAMLLDYLGVW